jgi:hypothetical protein
MSPGLCLCWWGRDRARSVGGIRGAGFRVLNLDMAVIDPQYFRKTWIAQEAEKAAVDPMNGYPDVRTTLSSLCSWLLEYVRRIHLTRYRKLSLLLKVIDANSSYLTMGSRQ